MFVEQLATEEAGKHIIKQLRVNERIIAREIRLVGEKGEQLGVMSAMQARELAKKSNLDLVEVAPTSVPPVCRLLDYGKFKYEQQKKEQQAKKSQKIAQLREIWLYVKIGVHDFDAKAKIARKLLNGGSKVKLTLKFKGREMAHPELGMRVLQRMVETLNDVAALDRQPILEGRRMNIIIVPIGSKPKVKTETKPEMKTETKVEIKAGAKEV